MHYEITWKEPTIFIGHGILRSKSTTISRTKLANKIKIKAQEIIKNA